MRGLFFRYQFVSVMFSSLLMRPSRPRENTRAVQIASKLLWQVKYIIMRELEDVKSGAKEAGGPRVALT